MLHWKTYILASQSLYRTDTDLGQKSRVLYIIKWIHHPQKTRDVRLVFYKLADSENKRSTLKNGHWLTCNTLLLGPERVWCRTRALFRFEYFNFFQWRIPILLRTKTENRHSNKPNLTQGCQTKQSRSGEMLCVGVTALASMGPPSLILNQIALDPKSDGKRYRWPCSCKILHLWSFFFSTERQSRTLGHKNPVWLQKPTLPHRTITKATFVKTTDHPSSTLHFLSSRCQIQWIVRPFQCCIWVVHPQRLSCQFKLSSTKKEVLKRKKQNWPEFSGEHSISASRQVKANNGREFLTFNFIFTRMRCKSYKDE